MAAREGDGKVPDTKQMLHFILRKRTCGATAPYIYNAWNRREEEM
jgi:hypothetical protein